LSIVESAWATEVGAAGMTSQYKKRYRRHPKRGGAQ